jgi:ParB family chromosome partitioning protein
MSKRRSALGKGLGALLPEDDRPEEDSQSGVESTPLYNFEDRSRHAGSISEVKVDRVDPNPYQPREKFDEELLEELTTSIRQLGIIQPITVRSLSSGRFELISGERRLKAARRAGLRSIPAYIREADSEAMLEMAIVENVQREQLNPVEVALGYRRLMEECSLTQEEVADKVGKNRSTVANFLRLLKLPPVIQAGLRDDLLSMGHARALLPLETVEQQRDLLEQIVEKDLSVRDVEKRVRKLTRPKSSTDRPRTRELTRAEELELRRMTDDIRRHVGTKVAIKPASGGDGGKIELEYYSDEDLERLVQLLSE